MGTANIVYAKPSGDGTPVFLGVALDAQQVTTSGTTARTPRAAPQDCVARITTDTAGYAHVGQGDVDAAVGTTWRLVADGSLDLAITAGDKVAFIEG